MLMESNDTNKTNGISLSSRQIYNPFWGIININEDNTVYITYNPLENGKPNRYIKKFDETAVTIYNMLRDQYIKTPKKINVDMEHVLEKIKILNDKTDPLTIFLSIFSTGQRVKFKVYTFENKSYARLMLNTFEIKIKNI